MAERDKKRVFTRFWSNHMIDLTDVDGQRVHIQFKHALLFIGARDGQIGPCRRGLPPDVETNPSILATCPNPSPLIRSPERFARPGSNSY